MPHDCKDCAAYSVCHGGCRAVQELRPEERDPLHVAPLGAFERPAPTYELPGQGRPRAELRIRREPFGYTLLGQGRVMPIHSAARQIVEACDGKATFSELAEQFGPAGLNLLGELWAEGMIDIL